MESATLFDYLDEEVETKRPKTLEEKFEEFDRQHPEVYRALVRLAREWVSVGGSKLGIATLFERLRWEWHVAGLRDSDGYKLNNSYRALYARKIMALEPDLVDLFETRVLSTERN